MFADQEGGAVKTFAGIAPRRPASAYASADEAFAAGRATAAGLRRLGVDATFAPVLDLPDGPLGSRQFARPEYGVAFARGLGGAACVKHFPGLGSTVALDRRGAGARRRCGRDLAPFRAAIRAGVPCVMVGHAIYPRLGSRRASFEPATYRLLRGLGFDGVAITDSLGVLGSPYAPFWARLAIRAGADLVLTTSSRDAARMVDALVPLARRGELDDEGRQGAAVPPLAGRSGTVTVTVAPTALPFVPTARAERTCGPGASSGGVPAEGVGRGEVGAAERAVDRELDALGTPLHEHAPEHEAVDLAGRR